MKKIAPTFDDTAAGVWYAYFHHADGAGQDDDFPEFLSPPPGQRSGGSTNRVLRLAPEDARRLFPAEALPMLNEWLARGDGVAVYENVEVGHPEQGAWTYASFGSPAAEFPGPTPPDHLPEQGRDTTGRGRLVGIYEGPAL